MELDLIIRYAFYGLYWLLVLACVLTIIHELRDPSRSLSWILVIITFPIGGIILFFFFGQNFRRKWIISKRESRLHKYIETNYKKQLKEIGEIEPENDLSKNQQIITLLLNNSRSLLTNNNSVQILHDGKKTFEEIISALKSAKSSINLEYYIFEEDELSKRICDILIAKAKEGVSVRFLYDDVGSWKLKRRFIANLQKEGIKTSKFFPVAFPLLSSRLNNRNHRKIIVIDGETGFTGGINIAQRYLSDKWHDTHLKIEGDAAKMLQAVFLTDWHYATKEAVTDWRKYICLEKKEYGHSPIQIAASGPNAPWASIMQAYFEAISKARKSIYISTPYFTPTQTILTALKVAALGGVDVRIMLPKKSDVWLADMATKSYFQELMEAGIKIYLYSRGFVHTKMICVDENICSIGSVNMDERSFEDNFEITAVMYDRKIIQEATTYFLNLCEKCKIMTLSKWHSRAHRNELFEALARLISPLL